MNGAESTEFCNSFIKQTLTKTAQIRPKGL